MVKKLSSWERSQRQSEKERLAAMSPVEQRMYATH